MEVHKMKGSRDTSTSRWSLFRRDTRGVSVAVDHALGLLILLVITGVFVSGITTIHDERQSAVTEQELDRIGDEVAAGLAATDSMAQDADTRQAHAGVNETGNVTTRVTLPSSVGGESYSVAVSDPDGDGTVDIRVRSGHESVTTTVTLENTIEAGSVSNGDMVIRYTNGTITVEAAHDR